MKTSEVATIRGVIIFFFSGFKEKIMLEGNTLCFFVAGNIVMACCHEVIVRMVMVMMMIIVMI